MNTIQGLQWINVAKYPLDRLGSPELETLCAKLREELAAKGICVLEDFVSEPALAKMVVQASSLIDAAYHSEVSGNAYLEPIDQDLPADHPRRKSDTTSLSVVAYDQIDEDDVISEIYRTDALTKFIATIVNLGPLYHYSCPLGALNLSVMEANDYLRWHFDQTDFVVSIPLQDAESGGVFEFVHKIRDEDNENYEAVAALLNGDYSRVERVAPPPGSLVLFQGRHTIHRVTKIEGAVPRLGALLGYDTKEGTASSDYLKQIRYGRAG